MRAMPPPPPCTLKSLRRVGSIIACACRSLELAEATPRVRVPSPPPTRTWARCASSRRRSAPPSSSPPWPPWSSAWQRAVEAVRPAALPPTRHGPPRACSWRCAGRTARGPGRRPASTRRRRRRRPTAPTWPRASCHAATRARGAAARRPPRASRRGRAAGPRGRSNRRGAAACPRAPRPRARARSCASAQQATSPPRATAPAASRAPCARAPRGCPWW
mmetsp:Transcript_28570/g.66975  ORF Transcript_28570/g.66975 Transcript_28570/m.66975 type:complete len:219 (+) Transcript_28570:2716-3372(+)